jgi:hypothetical protein
MENFQPNKLKRIHGTPLLLVSPQELLNAEMMLKRETKNGAPEYRDVPFSILFFAHLAVMVWLAIDCGTFTVIQIDPNVTNWRTTIFVDDDNAPNDEEWHQFEKMVQDAEDWAAVYLKRILENVIIPSAFVAYGVSYILTALVIPSCPTAMVVSTLLGSLAWTLALTIFILAASGFNNLLAFLFCGAIMAAVVYYLRMVWRLIPFTAVNLQMALQGISANCGMYIVAFSFSIVGFAWTLLWIYIGVGVMQAMDGAYEAEYPRREGMSKGEYTEEEQNDPLRGFVSFALLLSLYWTSKILFVRFDFC